MLQIPAMVTGCRTVHTTTYYVMIDGNFNHTQQLLSPSLPRILICLAVDVAAEATDVSLT